MLHRLALPTDLPTAVKISVFWYLAHVLLQGKVALLESTGFFAFLFLAWAAGKRQVTPSAHILYLPLFLYGVASSVSALFAARDIHGNGEAMLWVKMMIFPTALILFRVVPRVRDLALAGQMIFGLFIGAYGLVQFFLFGRRELETRITGSSTHVMTYSGLLLPIALLMLVLWIHSQRWWILGGATLLSLALLLTFTRSIWIGWLGAVVAIISIHRPRWFIWAAPALVLFLSFMPLPLFGRLMSTFDLQQSSNLDRVRMAEAGLEIIKDYPVLGVGPANVKEYYPLYRRHDAPRFRPPHLHNNVIQLWAERGVVALAAYLMLLVLYLRECAHAWRGRARPFAQAGVAMTVGLFAAGLFEFNFGDTEVFYLFLEMMALTVAFMEKDQGVDEWLASMGEVGDANGAARWKLQHEYRSEVRSQNSEVRIQN